MCVIPRRKSNDWIMNMDLGVKRYYSMQPFIDGNVPSAITVRHTINVVLQEKTMTNSIITHRIIIGVADVKRSIQRGGFINRFE
ncbi:hypothetical protein DPMN_047365 [Dreissena polymorpha]|uniref:Uncharacterized protein n=1 Tax=Dreissena polymorpha TaxID=45954 RepID=A0A9D4D8M6_DREPO|nr:hypothetical protein DPMN_047365 [Dreissena polymorpha]